MNLTISPKAQSIIAGEGNIVTVKVEKKVSFGWGGPQVRTIPSVRRGTPEANEADEYEQSTVNGATVYVHNSLNELGHVEIDAAVSVFGSKLVLRGVQTESGKGCCS